MSASATQGGHKEEHRKTKPQDDNIMAFPIPQGGHNNILYNTKQNADICLHPKASRQPLNY